MAAFNFTLFINLGIVVVLISNGLANRIVPSIPLIKLPPVPLVAMQITRGSLNAADHWHLTTPCLLKQHCSIQVEQDIWQF